MNALASRWPRAAARLAQAGIGAIFVSAAVGKASAMGADAEGATMWSATLSEQPALAWSLLVVEMMVGLWLIARPRPRVGLAVAVALLGLFVGAVAAELRRPSPRPCGCTHSAGALTDPGAVRTQLRWSLARNLLLTCSTGALLCAQVAGSTRRIEPRGDPLPGEGGGHAPAVP